MNYNFNRNIKHFLHLNEDDNMTSLTSNNILPQQNNGAPVQLQTQPVLNTQQQSNQQQNNTQNTQQQGKLQFDINDEFSWAKMIVEGINNQKISRPVGSEIPMYDIMMYAVANKFVDRTIFNVTRLPADLAKNIRNGYKNAIKALSK